MTRTSLQRPTLLPGLRPLWRDPHTVQLGTDPAQAVVLELPHPAAAKLLDLLDGSHTERAISAEMSRIGMSGADVQIVLGALVEAGLVVAAHSLLPAALPLDHRHRVASEAAALALRFRDRAASPASILRRRYRSRVIIAGTGPFAPLLISALLAAGVGTVGHLTEPGATATPAEAVPLGLAFPPPPPAPPVRARRATQRRQPSEDAAERGQASGDPPERRRGPDDTAQDDTAQGRAAQSSAAQSGAAQGGAVGGGRGGRVKTVRADDAFVVQIGRMARVPVRGARQRRPLLAISVRDGVAIVGPLVPSEGGPCLRCLELHRTDRDPAWPRLAAQLAEQDTSPVPCAAATVLSAAGLATAEILAYVDGAEPSTVGSTVEISGAGPWRRRSWTPHAGCDCNRRR